MQQKKTFNTTINDTTITVSFTDMAEHADGSVLVEAGDTVVFVTAVMAKNESTRDYFPLSVDFEERFYSVGAILGSRFMRREGRPSQEAILNARIIDRSIRPLFPKGLHRDVQVVATVLSFGTYNPDVLAVLGTSLALGTSSIPWDGPISAVRYVETGGAWQTLVPFETTKESTDHLLLCGKEGRITMVEMEGREVSESDIASVSKQAFRRYRPTTGISKTIIKEIGTKKITVTPKTVSPETKQLFDEHIKPTLHNALFNGDERVHDIEQRWRDLVFKHTDSGSERHMAESLLEETIDTLIHIEAVEQGKRVDGRGLDEVRPLFAQPGGISPRLHGSGLFYRGGTHVFTAITLGSPEDALALNTVEDPDANERFMHHYNFPPYSTGETGRIGSPKRREIGHGALAEKALRHVLPSQDEFPYTMRLVSECFSSNGSTSMASVCASTLALMDGGVPISAPVAGIAIGLMQRGDKYAVLTDIQGPEDHYGDMDFKVAGTEKGVTAVQMDVKIEGITHDVLVEALEKGRVARLHILQTITDAIAEPRSSLSPYAPHIQTVSITPDSIGLVIGSGGKTIKALRTDTGVDSIDIDDDGTVTVSGEKEKVAVAVERITAMTRTFEVGDTLTGPVKSITDFGAFIELSPNKDGMVHISEFSPSRISAVSDVVSVGDTVPVVVKEVRPDGRIALSVKDRDPAFFNKQLENQPPQPKHNSGEQKPRRNRKQFKSRER